MNRPVAALENAVSAARARSGGTTTHKNCAPSFLPRKTKHTRQIQAKLKVGSIADIYLSGVSGFYCLIAFDC